MELNLNLLAYQERLQVSAVEGKSYIYDIIRKRQMVLTPEEIVRQLCLHYLMDKKQVNINRINVEKQLIINGRRKRFDIIVYGMDMHPFLLVECKAASVPISQATFHQVAQYNLALKTDYLLVTNGQSSYCCQMDYEKESFTFLKEVPLFV